MGASAEVLENGVLRCLCRGRDNKLPEFPRRRPLAVPLWYHRGSG